MYLTKLLLNAQSHEVRRDLANPYELHRTLSRVFAVDASTAPVRFLWRLGIAQEENTSMLFVQSEHKGNWDVLARIPEYLQDKAQEKAIQPDVWLTYGNYYRFLLKANPTVTRNGKRRGLYQEEAQQAWLIRQGLRHGFIPSQVAVKDSIVLKGQKGNHCLSVLTTTFEGYLQVIDKKSLLLSLQHGIGPAKSLGCGLLSLSYA